MKPGQHTYWTLFSSTLELSAFTFGGGYVIVPLMRQKFVEQLHWIDEQEMLDLIAITQSAPGAIAVNASILIGYRIAKVPGALITMLGTILPPLVIISIISMFYTAFRDNVYVSLAMKGMLAGVAAVICNVVWNMASQIFKLKKLLPIAILIGAFIAVRFFHINILLIIIICGLLGALQVKKKPAKTEEDQA